LILRLTGDEFGLEKFFHVWLCIELKFAWMHIVSVGVHN
jgi:hypothetical protein